ncbi:MAG: hypothetical protein ACR2ML_01320 [Solirubrobacteraceae bacterium]|jgi:hypothetical protein
MPRHVHPHPRSKHGRAHVRHHRERAIARRWREAKNDWGTISPTLEYKTGWSRPELSGAELAELERLTGSRGPVYFVHPEEVASVLRRAAAYPFSLGRGHFARHAPHVGCSCALCKPHKPAGRARPVAGGASGRRSCRRVRRSPGPQGTGVAGPSERWR